MGSYSGIIGPLIWVITIVTLLITPLITTHEPPSRGGRVEGLGFSGGLNPEPLGRAISSRGPKQIYKPRRDGVPGLRSRDSRLLGFGGLRA